ncbi:MAG TPA: alcohol dehydrogenase catalytic domain-containing protein [Candidatus Acidoferrales bacterium]|nr:alcohol dehydrogenase catalytic domain-containing protein [Candidatus Acidoferrales bacterium]
MKAIAVRPAARRIEIVEHPEPALAQPTQVLMRMLRVGICGTDREICAFDYGTPPTGSDYLVIGHESLAEVVEVGAAVTGLAPGQLVVLIVRRPCGRPECVPCAAGRQDFCTTGAYRERGIKGEHGFMTERVVEDARFLVPLPASLHDVGVLVEPLTIAEKALLEARRMLGRMPWRGDDLTGLHAIVLGGGPVGLLGAMALATAGCRVTLISRQGDDDVRAGLMRTIGGAYVSAATDSLTAILGRLGTIDLVYEAIGAAAPAFEALAALPPNALFVFTGVPGRRGAPDVDGGAVMRALVLGNQLVLGSVNAGRDAYEAAVADLARFMTRWPQAVRALVTGSVPLDGAVAALSSRSDGIKTVVEIGA